jgi:hypothetical protein
MKNTPVLFATAIVMGFMLASCGPSMKEKEAKRVADDTRVADSIAKVQGSMNTLNLATRTPDDKQFIKTAETKFRVKNVRAASEKIEDMAAKYAGFVTYSRLQNAESEYQRDEISRDSIVISKKIIVENEIVLKIPNENLDSLVRELNKMIVFLDYRIIKMDEVTFSLLANQKASERLKNYNERQKKHIDSKGNKLKETTQAEENILNRQSEADDLQVEYLTTRDQIKYCTLTLYIYQEPFFYKETQVLLNTDSFKPGLFTRILNALISGWSIFEYFIVFLFSIWWLTVIIAVAIVIVKIVIRKRKK